LQAASVRGRSNLENQFMHHSLPVHLGYLKVTPKKAICSVRQPVVARCDAPEVLEAAERASEMGQISASIVVWDAGDDRNACGLPGTRRPLSSTPFQSSSGECRLKVQQTRQPQFHHHARLHPIEAQNFSG
jgi:hypothetical protein